MKWSVRLMPAIILIIGGGALAISCDEASEETVEKATSSTIRSEPAGPNIQTAAALYTCPMHPEVVTIKAGEDCPLCGMDLVPVAHGDAHAGDHEDHDGDHAGDHGDGHQHP